MLPTIDFQDDAIIMVDQRKLPAQEVYVRCRTAPEVAKAIRTMVIRGAPAIGVTAAYGIALGVRNSSAKGTKQLAVDFQKICELMARLFREAKSIHDEDVASCRAMGAHGAEMVPDGARILTHCNAGALATA